MQTTKVSVIIPAYNQGHYLAEAIQSVLDQTYPDFEILVIDDGSTDNTAEVASSFIDSRVHYIYQDNRGLSAARNTGLRHAGGEFISYLDSDDRFFPRKLAILTEALVNNPHWGVVAGRAVVIDEHGQTTGNIYASPVPEPVEKLLLGNPLHVGSVLVRRSWQNRAGEFDETLRSYEDWDMWLRLARIGCEFGWVDEPVAYYRFHTAQMTRIGRQMTQATFAVLDKVYSQPDLPASWLETKNKAYSNANLRAMAQAYLANDIDMAKIYLQHAIRLDPTLVAGEAAELARRLSALSESPKNTNRLSFLERIYANLPDEAAPLHRRASQELSQAAYRLALEAVKCHDYQKSRHLLFKAIQYQPSLLTRPGVLPTILKVYFPN